ncbi:unnamed protein product [Clonostachys rosea]|uniref:Uncharacterized protein n=1 Tax=Bionectria ochroleuca TaxID=29856 RepID=A0ABY6U7T1_BIOOC|nr:unnamed protein product [Clonostachys rosea]
MERWDFEASSREPNDISLSTSRQTDQSNIIMISPPPADASDLTMATPSPQTFRQQESGVKTQRQTYPQQDEFDISMNIAQWARGGGHHEPGQVSIEAVKPLGEREEAFDAMGRIISPNAGRESCVSPENPKGRHRILNPTLGHNAGLLSADGGAGTLHHRESFKKMADARFDHLEAICGNISNLLIKQVLDRVEEESQAMRSVGLLRQEVQEMRKEMSGLYDRIKNEILGLNLNQSTNDDRL